MTGEFAIGEFCFGECQKTVDGVCYSCPRCGVRYCYTCAYYVRWTCPKCGANLV